MVSVLTRKSPGPPAASNFSKDASGERTHQVHACAVGHPQVPDLLAFRDYLRANPARTEEYGALKKELARRHPHDIVAYMRGKDAFVKGVLAEARAWARSARRDV